MILLLVSCTSKYIFIDSFKGQVHDNLTDDPIKDVVIYVDSVAFNAFVPIRTDNQGKFEIEGLFTHNYDSYVTFRKNISYHLIFKADGYETDTLDLTEYNADNRAVDIRDLGKIYLIPKDGKE